MPISNSQSAARFRQNIQLAQQNLGTRGADVTHAEVKSALNELSQATDLSGAEKAQLAQEALSQLSQRGVRLGLGSADALSNFIKERSLEGGNPATFTNNAMSIRISNALEGQVDALGSAADRLATAMKQAKGGNVDPAAINEVKTALAGLTGDFGIGNDINQLMKGGQHSLSGGEVSTLRSMFAGAQQAAQSLSDQLNVSKGGGADVPATMAALDQIVGDLEGQRSVLLESATPGAIDTAPTLGGGKGRGVSAPDRGEVSGWIN